MWTIRSQQNTFTRQDLMLTVHLLWILNNLHQYFCNWNMDSPPKKWHLTQQFLMEVTREEGLECGADLAAHVSEVFCKFIPFLNSLLYYLPHFRRTMRWQCFRKDFLNRWTLLPYQVTSVHLIFLFPTESSPRDYLVGGLMGTMSSGEESYSWQGRCRSLTTNPSIWW